MKFKKVKNFLIATMLAAGMLVTELGGAFGAISGSIVAMAKVSDYQALSTSFEEETPPITPKPRYGGGTASIVGDEGAHTGTKCAKITGRTENWHGICFDISQYAGARIHFKCWVKTDAAQAMLTAENDGNNYYHNLATVASAGEWVLAEGDYDVKTDLPNKYVYVEATDKSDIYVDDIEITVLAELKEPPVLGEEVVVNGGFEENLTGWEFEESNTSTAVVISDVKASGENALKVSAGRFSMSQDVSGYVKKDTAYSISVSKAGAGKAEILAPVLTFGEGEEAVSVKYSEDYEVKVVTNGDFETSTYTYIIPSDVNLGSVSLSLKGEISKDVVIDDISMVEQRFLAFKDDAVAKKLGMSNPLVDTNYAADPYALEYNGRVYIYATNDQQQFDYEKKDGNGYATKDNGYGQISTLQVISSADMVNWTNHGVIPVAGKNNPDGIAKWANNSWAPAAAHKVIDGKDKFFLYFADNGAGIGVLEADSPVGPFREPETGSRLIAPGSDPAKGVVWLFDPAVLVDDDGTGYLYYGGGVDGVDPNMPKTSRAVKLKDNMVELDGDPVVIEAPAIFEDSGIHKYNNKYYYTYCSNFSNTDANTGQGNICAMVSDSPMGPFTYDNMFLKNMATFFGVGGNNHHAVFSFKDKWYVTYHAQTLGKAVGKANGYRSVHINELTYDESGHINPVTATYEGVAQLESFDPYTRIEAETFAWQSGVTMADCTEDGVIAKEQNRMLDNVVSNTWVALNNVDFGTTGAKTFTAKYANKTAGGTVEIRLDDINSEAVATLAFDEATEEAFVEKTWTIDEISGTHRVFLVFNGLGVDNGLDVDYYKFGKQTTDSDISAAQKKYEEMIASADKALAALKAEDKAALQSAIAAAKATVENGDAEVTAEDIEAAVAKLAEAVKAANAKIASYATTPAGEKVDENAVLKANIGKIFEASKLNYKIVACDKTTKTVVLTGVKAKTKLKSVKVPDTVVYNGMTFAVTEIGASAFKGQTKLTKATIGANVTKIGAKAFSGDKKLKSVTIKSKVLTSIGKSAFSKVNKPVKFSVPKANKKAYTKLIKKAGTKHYKVK